MDSAATAAVDDAADNWIFVTENPEEKHENEFTEEIRTEDSDTDSISIIGECESDEASDITIEHIESPTDISTHDHKIDAPSPKRDTSTEMATHGKMKTYVHRNNPNLNRTLNLIVLGTVLTAIGLAIGHMWGVQDDCVINANTTASDVVYNLHQLQLENDYLRNRLTELEKLRVNTVRANVKKQSTNDSPVLETGRWKDVDDPTVLSQMKKQPLFRDSFDKQLGLINSIYDKHKRQKKDDASAPAPIFNNASKLQRQKRQASKPKRAQIPQYPQLPKRFKEYTKRAKPSNGDWYSKLASGRRQVRDRITLKDKAQWYFERMHDREQCRKAFKGNAKNNRNRTTRRKR